VEEVVSVAKANNFVLPTAYQGSYSPITRKQETKLFPTLRKNNIAFYAYSPLAGGFLTKTKDQLLEGGKGRWDPGTNIGKLYHSLYKKPALLEALSLWEQISTESGIPRAELAYRWVSYHSILDDQHGDAIIFSASSVEQLKQTIAGLEKGPLGEDVAKKIDAVWKSVENESPLDNFNTSL
jgi:aflatoxin B1 aldehyde reductase